MHFRCTKRLNLNWILRNFQITCDWFLYNSEEIEIGSVKDAILERESLFFLSNFFFYGNKKLPDKTGLNKRFTVEWTDWPFDITDIPGLVQFTARLLQIAPSPQSFRYIVPEKRSASKMPNNSCGVFFFAYFIYLFNSFCMQARKGPSVTADSRCRLRFSRNSVI